MPETIAMTPNVLCKDGQGAAGKKLANVRRTHPDASDRSTKGVIDEKYRMTGYG